MRRVLLAVALVALAAAPAQAETTVGLEVLTVNGTHTEQAGNVPLHGVAPLLELRQRWHSVDITLEGIPATGGRGYLVTPNGYPHPLTNVSLFNALAHVSLGPTGRFWAGGGITVINQETSLLSPPLAAASRVTGGRYEVVAYLPSGRIGTVELRAAYMPALHGSVSYRFGSYPVPPGSDSEVAEATDLTAEYLWRLRGVTLGAGARWINYSAHFVTPATVADRNSSIGAILEARFRIAR